MPRSPSSGIIPSDLAEIPCSDSDGRASKYFPFVIDPNAAGAIKITADQGDSTMRPELIVRSGADAYTGTILFQDTRPTVENALAAGLVAEGSYTLQLRSTAGVSEGSGRSGAYSLQLTRLQPVSTLADAFGTTMTTGWDVGVTVSSNSLNRVYLPLKLDYKETEDTSWTSATASVSPANGERDFTTEVTGLTVGNSYRVRAAYTNSATYVESDEVLAFGLVQITGPPYGVQASTKLINENTGKYRIRVEWETPPFTVDDDTTWGYWLRLDEGTPFPNPTGYEHSQEHHFLYSRPGLLSIEVRNNFECTATTGHCDVTYNLQDYDIPAGTQWLTVWSAPATVHIPRSGVGPGKEAEPNEPAPAVMELIGAVMAAFSMTESPTLARTLSVLICLALATAAAFAITRKFGMRLAPVVLATLVWYVIFAGLGLEFFGVPAPLVMVLVIAPLALGSYSLIRRFGH